MTPETPKAEEYGPQIIYHGLRPFCPDLAYCNEGRMAGWILCRHQDGQWVSIGKVPPSPSTAALIEAARDVEKWLEKTHFQSNYLNSEFEALYLKLCAALAAIEGKG